MLRTGHGIINDQLNICCCSECVHSLQMPLHLSIASLMTHLATYFWKPGIHWSNSGGRLTSAYASEQLWMRISLRSLPRGDRAMSLKTQAGPESNDPAPGRRPRELKFRVEEFKASTVHECSWAPKSNLRNCLYQRGMT